MKKRYVEKFICFLRMGQGTASNTDISIKLLIIPLRRKALGECPTTVNAIVPTATQYTIAKSRGEQLN